MQGWKVWLYLPARGPTVSGNLPLFSVRESPVISANCYLDFCQRVLAIFGTVVEWLGNIHYSFLPFHLAYISIFSLK